MTHNDQHLTALTTTLRPNFGWAEAGAAKLVMDALEQARPNGSRFVGGCVRDSLLGILPNDIDIATQLVPDDIVEAVLKAGLKAVPTGIEHGTITAVADGIGVEVTTLRADVTTDGRRATVAFTEDWETDATRRDFTLNAIYFTSDGYFYDPVGGVAAAQRGKVEFIGDARMRIKEDYLRILRFFRFSARFANEFDGVGVAACQDLKSNISSLSAERIGDEFCKILELPNAPQAINAMHAARILDEIWSHEANISDFMTLKQHDPAAAAPLGLAVLFGDRDHDGDRSIDAAIRLSNAQALRRKSVVKNIGQIERDMTTQDARATLYKLGEEKWQDAVALARVRLGGDKKYWDGLRALPNQWNIPVFPVGGKDILALGIEEGPQVAVILERVEKRWIAEEFPDEVRVRKLLAEIVANSTG